MIFSWRDLAPIAAMSFALAACGQESRQEAVSESALGTYVCEAYDPHSGPGSLETGTGASRLEAQRNVLSDCFDFTGHVCVLVRCYDDARFAEGGDEGWACRAEDDTDRTWVSAGATRGEAEDAALASCASDAGIQCRLNGCFDTSEVGPI